MKFNGTILYIGFVQKSEENGPTKTLVDALKFVFQVILKKRHSYIQDGPKRSAKMSTKSKQNSYCLQDQCLLSLHKTSFLYTVWAQREPTTTQKVLVAHTSSWNCKEVKKSKKNQYCTQEHCLSAGTIITQKPHSYIQSGRYQSAVIMQHVTEFKA